MTGEPRERADVRGGEGATAYRRARAGARVLGVTLVIVGTPVTASPQEPEPAAPVEVDARMEPVGISPGGAFLRAVLVPGWGHAAIGSYTRGGFYFGAEIATAYTLVRTRQRLDEARGHRSLVEAALRQDLTAEGITDPAAIDARLDEDADLRELRELVEAREQQQEDLVALGLFLLFLSGADAYVSAHLADFPAPIELEAAPSSHGRMDVGIRLRLPSN